MSTLAELEQRQAELQQREHDLLELEYARQTAELEAAREALRLEQEAHRAVLREALRRQRSELQSALNWLGAQIGGDVTAEVASITAREHEVLALMGQGQTNAQIASALAVSEGAVKYHVKNLLRKLGARNRADAVARYARATGPGDE